MNDTMPARHRVSPGAPPARAAITPALCSMQGRGARLTAWLALAVFLAVTVAAPARAVGPGEGFGARGGPGIIPPPPPAPPPPAPLPPPPAPPIIPPPGGGSSTPSAVPGPGPGPASTPAVPEPGSLLLACGGALVLLAGRFRPGRIRRPFSTRR
jgi:hypothetical protein